MFTCTLESRTQPYYIDNGAMRYIGLSNLNSKNLSERITTNVKRLLR